MPAAQDPFADLPEPEILAGAPEPEAALAFWKAKTPMTPAQAKALGERERWRAFYIAGLAEMDQVQVVYDALGKAIQEGKTVRSFAALIPDIIARNGWDSHRIATIYHTNVQQAYSAGRYAQMKEVSDSRPYWQYLTLEDKRRRPSHAVLHGLVYPSDHEFWDANFPPNGFRCRCCTRTLSERQVKAQGLTVQTSLPKDTVWTDPVTRMEHHVQRPGADDGFRSNPGKDWMESLLTTGKAKLEQAAPPVASAAVRMLAHGGLAQWMKTPSGNFPLAVLKKESAARVGSKAVVAVLSTETLTKQQEHHPELTLADYLRVQDAVEFGEEYQQDSNNVAFVLTFVLTEVGGLAVIVKATRKGDELYITSVYRISEDDVKREIEVNRLKKEGRERSRRVVGPPPADAATLHGAPCSL